ncbi:MAG: outer membrane protein assembly factor BamA [Candidatus Omnitrophica bacterium 4484_213]|nr:MAG: outer membrane protein assembly factor BamA [Candidatus Omnitrophica bacterium 4484_213]
MRKAGIFFFIFFIVLSTLSWAAENEAPKIIGLKIEGNKRLSKAFILSCISSKIGRRFSPNILNDDIKRLYKTGNFQDVRVDFSTKEEGIEITITVVEKPILVDIIIVGNRVFSKKYINEIIGEGFLNKPLNKGELKKKIDGFANLYKQKGYYLAEVKEEVDIDAETNQATVYILIDEGNKIRIRRIFVEGNKEFSDKRILKLLKTKKKWWFNSGFFKEDVFKKDLERAKEFYQDAGYSDVKIVPDISYDERMRNMFITLNITEGNKYNVGKIIIKGNKAFEETEIKKELKLLPNTIFSDKKMREDARNIERFYFDRGYISCSVFPKTLLDKRTGKIDIVFQLEEGDLTYVNRVDIKGNAITRDVVIRRELEILPGDRFDGQKLRQSRESLKNLDYFEEINYDIRDTAVSDKKDLVVEVKEKKTGEFSFGGGYSSVDKGIGFLEIAQRNFDINNFPTFSGGGQDLRLRAELGRRRTDYLLSFTEPWFAGRPLSVGFDLYNRTWEREEDYDEARAGGDIRLGKVFNRIWRWNLTYCLEEVEISDISGNSSGIKDIIDEEGENMLSSLTGQIIRDTRDSKMDPHKGSVFTNSLKFAGLGGDKKFSKYISEINQYISPGEESRFRDLILELRLRVGVINDWNNSGVPIYERFYAGGAGTIRGYKYRKVGPRVFGEPVGGNSMLIANSELTFPLIKRVIKAALFYDLGNVWAKSSDIDLSDLKAGAGLGIRINTPIGPLKLDYGYGFDPDPGEKKEGHFYFSMSRAW